ncbi:uncharacterized protein LOC130130566 isoform X2 [Lampris incognitus]|uniref:uncharacterized protein LOC130130566 isoform X2 n=1 Tax=Lampris incognitus TaxID=2546036 RepID=UPI0024B60A68|nr:uncharacterized protein LOC130130566 isoform X2 [Lampris incognitus]
MDVRYRGLVATIKCLSVLTAIECATDCLPAPALSYQWTDAFHVKLNWQRPRTAGSSVSYRISDSAGHTKSTTEQFYDLSVSTEELDSGFWCTLYIESSNCEPSKPSKCTITPPVKLVKNFTCSLYDRDAVNCSWIPEKHSSDLQAFHRFFVDTENKVAEDIPLDCKSLGNNKMGSCTFVTRNLTDTHWILINGTLNGLPVHNTFKRQPNKYVKIPPPEVTIVEDGDHLTVTLKHVDVGPHTESCWDYQVSYSKCNEPEQQASSRVATVTIPYDKRCQYKFKAKAVFKRICGVGGSDFSEYKTHGANPLSSLPSQIPL